MSGLEIASDLGRDDPTPIGAKLAQHNYERTIEEVRALIKGLGQDLINAQTELSETRASHDRLLAAAEPALNVLENLPMGGDRDVNAALRTAIAAAEELK